jgi:two-component system, NtrC family, sensor kinase
VAKWRIRHKLMLGIGLVVGIMGFLLVGALAGLSSLRHTMRSIDSKLQELREANDLRADLQVIASLSDVPAFELSNKAILARDQLREYRTRLEATVTAGRDPDNGYGELQIVDALEEQFTNLTEAINTYVTQPHTLAQRDKLTAPIRKAKEDLVRTSDDLISKINRSLHQRIAASKRENTISIAVLVSTVTLAVLMTLGFGRIFYRWIVQPVRDLEQGVSRIATGDFDHRLDIRSGDEMEDLAKAYNEMSTKLRDIYRDLHNQVNERSRQLIRSERLAGVGFLAAGVAHEINNPLASIAFCSEALERRLSELFEGRRLTAARGDHLTEERDIVAKYLKMIQEEAFRCKEITQKLLAFSRGGERKREKTDLAELIQGVLDMVQHLQNCRGKALVFEPATPLDAWVNAQEVKQVFLNLVVNALDSMEEGGTLTITSSHRGEDIELVFRDTGCGMSGDVLENIFEPFFTRSRTGKGTGLGLSISHRIISSHGGDITATSAGPGQGSVFTVRLPVQPPAELTETGGEDMDPEAEFLKLSTARRQRAAA